MEKKTISCITDKPIKNEGEDQLCAKDYADALCEFIEHADTPVTLGLQGGWGSGKTSLISVMQDKLNNNHNILCIFVNAWEHSLFHDTDSKAEVALSLLNGLVDGIKNTVQTNEGNKINQTARQEILNISSNIDKIFALFKTTAFFTAKVASKMITGVELPAQEKGQDSSQQTSIAKNVNNLRSNLRELIGKAINHNNKQMQVVFFIDDLDRVPPPTAVEILDVTKNIFDIPNCVFVLAVDYEVIVKGLENKFGKKSPENEREFRQYFDKIIQIPFTMPVGSYASNTEKLLKPALERLGNYDWSRKISEDAILITGGNPRSIKRIINTLSLLQYIDKKRSKKVTEAQDDNADLYLEARFIITGLHINFPEICRKLMERPNFTNWKVDDLQIPWKLNMEDNTNKELEALEKDEYFNDEWEKVVYRLCVQSSWLKSQAKNLSQLLNRLLIVLNREEKDNKDISQEGMEKLNEIIESIRIVSIDSDTAGIQEYDDRSVKTDRVTMFFQNLHKKLSDKLPDIIPSMKENDYAKRPRGAGLVRRYTINCVCDDKIDSFEFEWDGDNEQISIFLYFNIPYEISIQTAKRRLNSRQGCLYNYDNDGKTFYYYYEKENIDYDSFINSGILLTELADVAEKLYHETEEAWEVLEKR